MLEDILKAIASFTLSAAIIAYLAKELLKLWISRDLESFKIRLQSEFAREAERLRAELARSNLEHEVRFSRLHEQRARVIAGLFGRLVRLHRAVTRLGFSPVFADPEQVKQLRNETITEFQGFVDYFHPRAIWLDVETSQSLISIIRNFQDVAIPLLLAAENARTVTEEEIRAAQVILDKEIPAARKQLLEQFRHLLGVEPRASAKIANTQT